LKKNLVLTKTLLVVVALQVQQCEEDNLEISQGDPEGVSPWVVFPYMSSYPPQNFLNKLVKEITSHHHMQGKMS
jgi:hypothetical protein